MFEDSLIESGGKLKTKRGMTSTIAFIFELMLIGVMVLIPLLFTEALPKAQLMMSLVARARPPRPPTGGGPRGQTRPDEHHQRPTAYANQDSEEN